MADAAMWGALVGILMALYPSKAATIMSWTEMVLGFGHVLGPAISGVFYDLGGFKLPFLVVGSIGFVLAIALMYLMPGLSIHLVKEYYLMVIIFPLPDFQDHPNEVGGSPSSIKCILILHLFSE